MNSDIETQLRRCRTNLRDSGRGYILFGLWTAIKVFMTATMNKKYLNDVLDAVDTEHMDADAVKLIPVMTVLVFLIIALVAVIVHLYIGLSAIRYSSGKKKTKFFLIFAAIIILMNLVTIPSYFLNYEDLIARYNDSAAASTLVDLTVSFLLADIIYSVYRMDKLKKMRV